MAKWMIAMTSVSLAAIDSGVNSVILTAPPNSLKNSGTSALPCLTPYQGAADDSAADAQSTSSVSWSTMKPTSPRPNAS
ncbi:hypothetical protein OG876_35805 [Kribbella sp. NBC_00359]